MKVAATQIIIDFVNVRENLLKAEALIKNAVEKKAELIVLPEFFTSGIAINPLIDEVATKNREFGVIRRLQNLSQESGIIICGSILNEINVDVYNSIFLIEPNGNLFIHNKDIPTQFENCYYTNGDEKRSYKSYGMAFCWEMLRSKTIREFAGDTKMVLSGSCWWDLPEGSQNEELREYNHELNRDTPKRFAELTHLPIVHASLKGMIIGKKSLSNDMIVKRKLIGTTQIVDCRGEILQIVEDDTNDGVIIEDIPLTSCLRRIAGNRYWLTDLRKEYLDAWERENRLGKEIYREKRNNN